MNSCRLSLYCTVCRAVDQAPHVLSWVLSVLTRVCMAELGKLEVDDANTAGEISYPVKTESWWTNVGGSRLDEQLSEASWSWFPVAHGGAWAMHPDTVIFSFSILFFSLSLLLPEIICQIKHLGPHPWLSLYFGGNTN